MREAFAEAARSYDEAAVLARAVGERLSAKLEWMRIAPRRLADIGCATGDGVLALLKRHPKAFPLAIDYALPMLQAVRAKSGWRLRLRRRAPRLVNADVRALPLAANCLDLVWSNLMLHWLTPADLHIAFREVRRVLAPAGLFVFAMLGPDTLKELRAALVATGGGDTLARFLDMHDVGDALLASGFAAPVMEMEMITMTYAAPRFLLADLRRLGVRDAMLGRQPWPCWRAALRFWAAQGSPLKATFEVIYGHAWRPEDGDGRTPLRFFPPHPPASK